MKHLWIFAGGAAVAGAVAGLAQNGILHRAAVAVTEGAMAAGDAISRETQQIADDAADRRAAARRQAKIDALVGERLAAMEDEVRKEATERVDAEGAGA